jgi:DNA-3-methyladenine glycosylase I
MISRCAWVPLNDPLYVRYHDEEWGVPVHDDRLLFEFLVLEGFQAGLSWSTVLYKRENFRQAFDLFDPQIIARYGEQKIAELMSNAGIIRNRSKILASITNARAFLEVQAEFYSFDRFIWQYVDGKPLQKGWESLNQLPSRTSESDLLSKELVRRGFRFVGSTICYAHMQATGMVNDHTRECFRFHELSGI